MDRVEVDAVFSTRVTVCLATLTINANRVGMTPFRLHARERSVGEIMSRCTKQARSSGLQLFDEHLGIAAALIVFFPARWWQVVG